MFLIVLNTHLIFVVILILYNECFAIIKPPIEYSVKPLIEMSERQKSYILNAKEIKNSFTMNPSVIAHPKLMNKYLFVRL